MRAGGLAALNFADKIEFRTESQTSIQCKLRSNSEHEQRCGSLCVPRAPTPRRAFQGLVRARPHL